MTKSAMVVRKCHDLDELSACVALQKEVWNFAEAELVPLRVFVVAEKIGGQVIGAFDDGQAGGLRLVPAGLARRTLLSSFANAGGAERNTAMPAWDGKSNCFNGRTLSPGDSN